jgi:hypothetical protein
MRKNCLAALILTPGFLTTISESQQTKLPPPHEQVRFGLEEPVIRTVPVPNAVLGILKTDSVVSTSGCVDQGQSSPDKISASWFEASEIHLSRPSEVDLLVKAKDGCLFGANIGPFWIFKNAPEGYELLLQVNVLAVELLRNKTNGYRNVSAGAVAGGKAVFVLYKFDGRKYRESGSSVQKETK